MLFLYLLFLIAGLTSTIVFIANRRAVVTVPVVVMKAVSSVFFILTAAAALVTYISKYFTLPTLKNSLAYGLMIIAGGCFGLLGDVWLDLKFVYPQHDAAYLYTGFCSFLLGHVCYSVAMAVHYSFAWYIWPIALAGGALIMLIGVFLSGKMMQLAYGKFLKIVCAYGFVLGTTLTISLLGFIVSANSGSPAQPAMMFFGMLLFLMSDGVLSVIYFGENKKTLLNIAGNHIFYYAAQFLIASSILFVNL